MNRSLILRLLISLVLTSCRRNGANFVDVGVLDRPSQSTRVYPVASGRLELELSVEDFISIGDTIPVRMERRRCSNDVCGRSFDYDSEPWTWTATPANLATLSFVEAQTRPMISDVGSRLVGQGLGVITIRASKGDTVLSRHVEIVRPVSTLAWEPDITSARVGDTIRTRAVARDAEGRVVLNIRGFRRILKNGHAAVSELQWNDASGATVVASGPGVIELQSTMGRHSALLRVTITAR